MMRSLTVQVEDELFKRIKIRTIKEGKSLKQYLTEALCKSLEDEELEENKNAKKEQPVCYLSRG